MTSPSRCLVSGEGVQTVDSERAFLLSLLTAALGWAMACSTAGCTSKYHRPQDPRDNEVEGAQISWKSCLIWRHSHEPNEHSLGFRFLVCP